MAFLPTTAAELRSIKADGLDFVLISGDAYVDHPSFGAALVGRWLQSLSYTVGIIARPDPDDVAAFRALGRPRLAWLVSGGNLDSMVCKYTANHKLRSDDGYALTARASAGRPTAACTSTYSMARVHQPGPTGRSSLTAPSAAKPSRACQ